MHILALGPGDGWHAEQLRMAADRFDIKIDFATYQSLRAECSTGHVIQCETTDGIADRYDVVLTRTMPMGTLEQITFRLSTLRALLDRGVPVVNSPRGLELAIDKYAATACFHRIGLKTPRTHVSQSRSDAMQSFQSLGGDVVVKPLFGGEGRGVMRVETVELAWTTFTTLEQLGAVIYQQEFIAPGGKDLRLLVVGDQVWAIERQNASDWRTNVSRGSSSRLVPTSDDHQQIARSVCEAFDLRIAGIDLIFDRSNTTIALEVNAVPGWKGAQRVVDANIAEQIVQTLRHG